MNLGFAVLALSLEIHRLPRPTSHDIREMDMELLPDNCDNNNCCHVVVVSIEGSDNPKITVPLSSEKYSLPATVNQRQPFKKLVSKNQEM
jgi:hypothetical protein